MAVERTAQRTRTLLRARIEFNGGLSTLDCSVRDLSETGARLEVADSVAMPGVFRLFIPKYQRWYDAETRWHRGESVGIEFVHQTQPSTAPVAGSDAKVAKLEAEIVKLRRIIQDIRLDPAKAGIVLANFE